MYNRYIPQPDGSYRRNRMDDTKQPQPQRKAEPQHRHSPAPQVAKSPCCEPAQPQPCHHQGKNVNSFLRQLLPKDFDTGDLIIVLLLLLLAGDCEEDKSTAMLTLVLYLFM